MSTWLRLSAHFHEHPKMLSVRKSAGSRADSAELGWYRLLMAAKRYGRWSFASEEHLQHVAGLYFRFVPLYRRAGLLDDLTVHDGETYNAIKTPAERQAEKRDRDKASQEDVTGERDTPRDGLVTLEERDREKTEKEERDRERERDDFDALDVYHELTGYRPWGEWSGDALRGAMTDYGDATVQAAMRTEYAVSGDRNDLLKRVQARLARDADKAKQAKAEAPRRVRLVVSDKDRLAAIEQMRAEAKEGA